MNKSDRFRSVEYQWSTEKSFEKSEKLGKNVNQPNILDLYDYSPFTII